MNGAYDVIIIGSGAGGGTLAHHLAPSGQRILLLERGDWLPREQPNWSTADVFVDGRYNSPDTWFDERGKAFQPQIHYYVGGATKMYGAALYRLRVEDFDRVFHHDGISPAWPIRYEQLEPYYTRAEQLYQVHGARGEDPTEPPASAPYPFPAVSHEPRIQQLSDDLAAAGMFHDSQAVLALSIEPNPTVFQKTLAVNDFYFRGPDFDYPLGNIQMIGKSQPAMYRGEKPIETKFAPNWALREVAEHAVDFWLSTEDLPSPGNRVTLDPDGNVHLRYRLTNPTAGDRLFRQLKSMLGIMRMHEDHLARRWAYMKSDIPVAGVAHQAGTCRFGNDPANSVLNANCQTHEVQNLYVVDTSFFPSIGAVNPALTAMANAMRVGDHLLERMGAEGVVQRVLSR
ncbi:GMC oxidoreductase [Dactylosporangium sp. NPDC049742]|uniref:GMC oxidoreductase n=1 Tax=Dactylosporangium sp. NPDC049742 TaxID=3154737 RepID=UPI003420D479